MRQKINKSQIRNTPRYQGTNVPLGRFQKGGMQLHLQTSRLRTFGLQLLFLCLGEFEAVD